MAQQNNQQARGPNPPPYAFYPNYLPPPYYMQPPVQQPLQQARLPAHNAQYLLRMTDVPPPPTGREIAVAGMQRALDNGTFADVETGGAADQATGRRERSTTFWVLVPVPGPNGATMTDVTLTINRHNLDPADFLARIRANMEVGDDVPLGWRISNEPKNANRRLQTVDDAKFAVESILKKIDSPNRRNDVMLKISDTREKAKAPAKPETKAEEMAYREELTIVKDKLRCQSQNHTYCYVPTTGPRVGQHISLTMQDVTYWAREMKNGHVPRDCSAAPNSLKTDEIVARHEELRKQRTSRPGAHVDVTPHIHINLADTPLGQVYRPQREDEDRPVLGKRVREESPTDDDPEIVSIDYLLGDLHAKMPAGRFPEYKTLLEDNQIMYCHQLIDHDEKELINLGIARAPAKDLLRGATKIMRRMKQQRIEEEKENHNVGEV